MTEEKENIEEQEEQPLVQKKSRKKWYVIGVILILSYLLPPHMPVYFAKGFSGTVVDAETKKPIEGVVLLTVWNSDCFNPIDSDDICGIARVRDDVTDKDGSFSFSGWGPKFYPPFQYLDYLNPNMYIFKKGYEPEYVGSGSMYRTNPGFIRSVKNIDGKTIELKKFKGTDEELIDDLQYVRNQPLGNLEYRNKHMKRLVRMANEFFKAEKKLSNDNKVGLTYDLEKHLGMLKE